MRPADTTRVASRDIGIEGKITEAHRQGIFSQICCDCDLTCHGAADNCWCWDAADQRSQLAAATELKEDPMLVLSRKVGEKLVIDGNIIVEVVKIQGNRITIGINAPADVKILRGELKQPKATTQTIELVVEDGLLVAC